MFQSHRILSALAFCLVVIIYIAGQFFIGTWIPGQPGFHFNAPADPDFLYYAGILKQLTVSFPPQNPSFGGVVLSQSFVQFYPAAFLSLLTGPYLAMKVVNLLYILLFGYLLYGYFRSSWGIGLAIICAGAIGLGYANPLGVDLIARGFNHLPFFICLTIALFETKRKYLRYGTIFLLGMMHSLLGLLALLGFGVYAALNGFRKEQVIDTIICAMGFLPMAIITASTASKPFYFPFVEQVRLDLSMIWPNVLPAVALATFVNDKRLWAFLGVAIIYGSIFQYNPYFAIFMINFITGWAALLIIEHREELSLLPKVLAIVLMVGFITAVVHKYNPANGDYYPHLDPGYAQAAEWLDANTPGDAVILTVPMQKDWQCRLMETRASYLGIVHLVQHIGIDWKSRSEILSSFYSDPRSISIDADYVIYGPDERKYFPNFNIRRQPVYIDDQVTIWSIPSTRK